MRYYKRLSFQVKNLTKHKYLIALFLGGFMTVGIALKYLLYPIITYEFNLYTDNLPSGSIFTIVDDQGNEVAGCGFQDFYNTRVPPRRNILQFYITTNQKPIIRKLDSSKSSYIYLWSINKDVYAEDYISDEIRCCLIFDSTTQKLVPTKSRFNGCLLNDVVVDKKLEFSEGQVIFDNNVILSSTDDISNHSFYFANDRVFYFSYDSKNNRSTINSIPLNSLINRDYSKLTSIEPQFSDIHRTGIYAWGIHQNMVFTCTNMGTIYMFNGKKWITLKEGEINTSYQIYSIGHFYNKLIGGHYPTGKLLEYNDKIQDFELITKEGFDLIKPYMNPAAREAQTLAIYGGRLFVGIWPWSELWSCSKDSCDLVTRIIKHPVQDGTQVHPYEEEASKHGHVFNALGQRITSLVPYRQELLISTGTKAAIINPLKDNNIIDDKLKSDYGAIYSLYLPGTISVPILMNNNKKQISIKIRISKNIVEILQDDIILDRMKIDKGLAKKLRRKTKILWGQGIFGECSQTINHGQVRKGIF